MFEVLDYFQRVEKETMEMGIAHLYGLREGRRVAEIILNIDDVRNRARFDDAVASVFI